MDLGYLTGGYVIRKRPDGRYTERTLTIVFTRSVLCVNAAGYNIRASEPQFEVSVDDGELIPGDVRIYNARKIARLLRKKHPPHMRFG